MAKLIKTDGSESLITSKADGGLFTLDELQELVGGYIQPIRLPSGQTMIINEDGKFLKLPRNKRATLLGAAAGIAPGDFVVGDAVILRDEEWN